MIIQKLTVHFSSCKQSSQSAQGHPSVYKSLLFNTHEQAHVHGHARARAQKNTKKDAYEKQVELIRTNGLNSFHNKWFIVQIFLFQYNPENYSSKPTQQLYPNPHPPRIPPQLAPGGWLVEIWSSPPSCFRKYRCTQAFDLLILLVINLFVLGENTSASHILILMA